MKTINRDNIVQHLLEEELWLSGHSLSDILGRDNWRFCFTLTGEQYASFRAGSLPLLKKVFKFNRRRAEETFSWFYQNFGLRIKEEI